MDAELVLDVAHGDTAVALVVDEHGEATSVVRALLRACQDEVQVRVAIGDEALHAIEPPRAVSVLCGLEHDTLQVGTGIGLGEVHRHGLALRDAGDVLLLLFLGAKLIQGVDAALQRPHVLEAGVGGSDDLRQHGEDRVGHVEAAETARHGDAPEACLARGVEVLVGLAGIEHATVLEVRAFEVDTLRVGFDDVGSHVARDVEQALVVLDGVGVVDRSVGELVLVSVASLLQLHDALHQGVMEVEFDLRMITIIVCHSYVLCEARHASLVEGTARPFLLF